MKKTLILLTVLALLLGGCAPSSDPDLLEYPGLKWNATMEEVQSVLGYEDADIVETATDEPEEDESRDYIVHYVQVNGLSMYGEKTSTVSLAFHEYPGHEPGLAQIHIYYPDGYNGGPETDMEAQEAKLTELYGPSTTEWTTYRWSYSEGELSESTYEAAEDSSTWRSRTTLAEAAGQESMEQMYEYLNRRWTAEGEGENLPTMEQFLQTFGSSAARIELRRTFSGMEIFEITETQRALGGTDYVVELNGSSVLDMMHLDRYLE